jgi:transposase
MDEKFNRVKKKPNGRPPELTDELHDKIINLIRAGNYIETAAIAAGISKQSLYTWMKNGNKQKAGKYRKFLDAINKAVGEAEAIDVNNIAKAAAKGNWTASAWRLERKHPQKWGRSERHEVQHSGAVITLNYSIEQKEKTLTIKNEQDAIEETKQADTELL